MVLLEYDILEIRFFASSCRLQLHFSSTIFTTSVQQFLFYTV